MRVQIYAFKTVEEVQACLAAGVDLMGVVVGENGQTPDETGFEAARQIFASLPAGLPHLALTVETEPAAIESMLAAVRPDILHLSGNISALPPEGVAGLRARWPGLKIMQAIPMEGETALNLARAYAPVSDYFLLDTRGADTPFIGATGATHDWSVSRELVRQSPVPVILAGGLSSENVAQAIRMVRPWGVDSNSHTNYLGTWRKDPERVRAFAAAARAEAE